MPKVPRTRSGERREQILEEALALFAEHGIQGVSTRAIAHSVGISQPSLYAHFATRDEIAMELCVRAFGRLHARLITASIVRGTPADRLLRLAREYVDFGLEHEAMYRVAFMIDQPDNSSGQESPVLAAGLRAFSVLLDLFVEVRGAHDVTTAAMAQSTWAAMHGLVALLLVRHEFPWVERETLVDIHLTRLCRGAFS